MTKTRKNTEHKTTLVNNIVPMFWPSYGNEKTGGKDVGMMAIGYYPTDDYIHYSDGSLVADIKGTCGCVNCDGCKGPCYAVSMIKRFTTAREHRIANTLQLRQDINQHFEDIRTRILEDKIKIIRYTDSGEIETYLQFVKLVNLALGLPSVKFYLYTKNYTVLREFFSEGKEIPNNMTVLISIWEDLGEKEYMEFRHHRNIKAFAIHPSTVKTNVMCPAYIKDEKTGRIKLNKEMTCAKCKLCFDSKAAVIGCLEH